MSGVLGIKGIHTDSKRFDDTDKSKFSAVIALYGVRNYKVLLHQDTE